MGWIRPFKMIHVNKRMEWGKQRHLTESSSIKFEFLSNMIWMTCIEQTNAVPNKSNLRFSPRYLNLIFIRFSKSNKTTWKWRFSALSRATLLFPQWSKSWKRLTLNLLRWIHQLQLLARRLLHQSPSPQPTMQAIFPKLLTSKVNNLILPE